MFLQHHFSLSLLMKLLRPTHPGVESIFTEYVSKPENYDALNVNLNFSVFKQIFPPVTNEGFILLFAM